MALDDIDRRILEALRHDARMSLADVSRRAGVALTTVHRRLHRLQSDGVIRGFHVDIDPVKIGLGVTAFVRVRQRFRHAMDDVYHEIAAIPEVEEVHVTAGDFDLLLKIRARDNQHVLELLNRLYEIMTFLRSATEICLHSPLERVTDIAAAPDLATAAGGTDTVERPR